jgi:hypothetical protein
MAGRWRHGFAYLHSTKSLVLMAGSGPGTFSDIWVLNRTSICACSPLSFCVDKSGTFECMPFVIPGTLSKSVATTSTSLDFIEFLLSTPTPGATIQTVTYGNALVGLDRFACTNLVLHVVNATTTKASCKLAQGLGTNFQFGILSRAAQAEYGCFTTRSQDTIGYPTPIFQAATLELADPAILDRTPSSALALTSALPIQVSFRVSNVLNASDLLMVRYGPDAEPTKYTCTVNLAETTNSRVVCTTQLGSQGKRASLSTCCQQRG